LAAFETFNTGVRIYEILQNPIVGEFDIAHLKAIHKQVFQDVFAWAGEFRTAMLGKAEYFGRPPTWFTSPHLLDHGAERIFGSLKRANLLRGLSQVQFAPEAARLLAEINKLHPFREGNGRTQRLFLDALTRQAGHELHFDVVSRERMVQASIEANAGSLGMMTRMFEEITDADRIQPLRRAIAFLSQEKFDWNETYIATTTTGESYTGRLVGRDGEAFMMRSDDNRILIGRALDIDAVARTGERIMIRAAT
jgi:cell filamentation protein